MSTQCIPSLSQLMRTIAGRPVRVTTKVSSSKRQPSPIELSAEESESESKVPSPKGKGKEQLAPRKAGTGMSPVQKGCDQLTQHLGLLHSQLYQVRGNIKALEVEHSKVMVELSDVVVELEELDI